MNPSGDGIRVVHPLFQAEGDGAIPISPLQLRIDEIDIPRACQLNELWHSRLPKLNNQTGDNVAFAAHFGNRFYAVAIWGWPVAREFMGRGIYELRRMAIAPDAPKNTATRMLRIMTTLIRKKFPDFQTLISYQDTAVHKGTIYKAAGWTIGGMKRNVGKGWNTRPRATMQTTADKIRWELNLSTSAPSAASPAKTRDRNAVGGCTSLNTSMDLFAGSASTNG